MDALMSRVRQKKVFYLMELPCDLCDYIMLMLNLRSLLLLATTNNQLHKQIWASPFVMNWYMEKSMTWTWPQFARLYYDIGESNKSRCCAGWGWNMPGIFQFGWFPLPQRIHVYFTRADDGSVLARIELFKCKRTVDEETENNDQLVPKDYEVYLKHESVKLKTTGDMLKVLIGVDKYLRRESDDQVCWEPALEWYGKFGWKFVEIQTTQ